MPLKRLLFVFITGLLLSNNAYGADTFKFDVAHSNIGFSVRHMAISNVKGSFTDFNGTFVWDGKNLSNSSVEVTIQTKSIDTGNEKRDEHLRTEDFFEVEKYPEITFESSSFEKSGDGYKATGTLTMHGVSKEVTIPFSILGTLKDPQRSTRLGMEGSLTLNRQDYGISWSKMLDNGGLLVGNEVKIELNIEWVTE